MIAPISPDRTPRVLIDVGHPAHIHYYRNLANELSKKGYFVFWTVKDIPIARKLLDSFGFTYQVFPGKSDRLIGKILKQFLYGLQLLRFCKRNNIALAIGTSATIAHVSRISKVRSIVFDDDDDEVQPLVTNCVNPFATSLLSPSALFGKRKRKDTIYYPGYHELAYLHPNRFQPDPSVLSEVGLQEGDRYFIMRFNAFKAHHDRGAKGLSLAQKVQLTEVLEPYGKVFISGERNIEPELQKYRLGISSEKIHSLMAFATLFLGDSQTMTSEAAMLGVPSLRCNTFAGRISTLNEQEEKYGLTFGFHPRDFEKLVAKLQALLAMPNLREEWQSRRRKMLEDKIDLTAFMVWFVSQYPRSAAIVQSNDEVFDQFK